MNRFLNKRHLLLFAGPTANVEVHYNGVPGTHFKFKYLPFASEHTYLYINSKNIDSMLKIIWRKYENFKYLGKNKHWIDWTPAELKSNVKVIF